MKYPVLLVSIDKPMTAVRAIDKTVNMLFKLDSVLTLDTQSRAAISINTDNLKVVFPLGVIKEIQSLSETLPEHEKVMIVFRDFELPEFKLKHLETYMKIVRDMIAEEIGEVPALTHIEIDKIKEADEILDKKLVEIFELPLVLREKSL